MMFKKAERRKSKLRAAICGTSGSGKTYSALLLARGLVGPEGRIAVIDTERGSASLYSDVTAFDVAEFEPPFSPQKYIHCIRAAEKTYDALIIDSLSHAWTGEGGVLSMHDMAAKADRAGNSFTAWRTVTPQHNALVDAILTASCHVIATMRSKTEYEMVDDGRGKKKPMKIGLAPVQRDGMEYEFTLVLDVSTEGNIATASKDRTRLWFQRNSIITEAHGTELREWLESGADEVSAPDHPTFPDPEPMPAPTEIPPDMFSKLAACKSVEECRLWVPAARQALGLKTPHDPLYQKIVAAAKARTEQLMGEPVETEASTEEEPQP